MASSFDRGIFTSGVYVECFHPDDNSNPFRALYEQKRKEVLALAGATLGDRASARVLDVGGGMGRVALPLALRYDVTLCDISESMLTLAREAAAHSQLPLRLQADLVDASQRLPYGDASVDLIVCLDLLVHLPDPQFAVCELFRVLKPGGTALIDNSNSVPFWTVFYPHYVGRRPSRWIRTFRAGGVLPEWAHIVHHHSRAQFHRMLSLAGFAVDEERHYGPAVCPKWHLAVATRPPRA